MKLPLFLQEAIDKELERQKTAHLSEASFELSERYRTKKGNEPYITKDTHRLAYLSVRLPATYAAVTKVLSEIKGDYTSLLDLGSGPGTAVFAALGRFPRLQKITAFEKDPGLIALGKRLSDYPIDWRSIDLEKVETLPPHDLIIMSYAVGELSENGRKKLIELASNAAKTVIVIEPGTPVGFERIRKIRADLIALGNHMLAPCPHTLPCPMKEGDWCHFAARLDRSSRHRQVKQGTLNYEDEKFSYVAVSKEPVPLPQSRVLRHPQKRPGNIQLTLCTEVEGLQQKIISKRTSKLYKIAKDLEWGDTFSYL